jgi:hypothetical protein
MSPEECDFFAQHTIETSDGRRWRSLKCAYSPVTRLSAVDTTTGQEYSVEELQAYAPASWPLRLGAASS